ncbi:hypothetical protein [Neorhodopirellula lusitana]|nr:hypothetical protein [Neorhodopirellula lusitana]
MSDLVASRRRQLPQMRGETMRVLIVVVVILVILGLVGWLRFSSPDGNPTIRVDTQKVKQDTSELMENSKQAVDIAAEKIDQSIDRDTITE